MYNHQDWILHDQEIVRSSETILLASTTKKKTKDLIKNTLLLSILFLAVNTFWILPVFSTVSTGLSILTHISTQDLSAFTSHDTIPGNILISLSMMYGFWRGGYTYPFHLAPHF